MRYLALATDYDDTLARDSRVDEATRAALERLRASGRRAILVTGRRLEDLLGVCDCADQFDYIVAENGAHLYEPANAREHAAGRRAAAGVHRGASRPRRAAARGGQRHRRNARGARIHGDRDHPRVRARAPRHLQPAGRDGAARRP